MQPVIRQGADQANALFLSEEHAADSQ
jgi:hypothetical protein